MSSRIFLSLLLLPFTVMFPAGLAAQSAAAGQGLQTLEVLPLPRDGEVLVSFKLNASPRGLASAGITTK